MVDEDLHRALEAALAACREALADYQAGVLGDEDVRRILFRHGMVQRDGEAWLLDLQRNQWWRYDGLAMSTARSPLNRTGVAHLRRSLDALARELGP